MVALRSGRRGFLGFGTNSGHTSARATAAAFKVGDRAYKKAGGATPRLKEVMRLYRETQRTE